RPTWSGKGDDQQGQAKGFQESPPAPHPPRAARRQRTDQLRRRIYKSPLSTPTPPPQQGRHRQEQQQGRRMREGRAHGRKRQLDSGVPHRGEQSSCRPEVAAGAREKPL